MSDVINAYNKLIDRACDLARTLGTSVVYEEFSRLSIRGDMAIIEWPEPSSGYYNSCDIETQNAKFPAYLLEASEAEVEAWKEEQRLLAEEANRQLAHRRAEEEKKRELILLAELQEKYRE